MKKRTAKKLNKYHFLPRRLINKFLYLSFCVETFPYSTVAIGRRCFIMADDGRIMIYSYVDKDGNVHKGKGYSFYYNNLD